MRNFKKVIAAGLALLMLALSVNVSFAAENYTAKEAEAVGKVNAAGIMTGTDKGFEPSKSLTRAEAAAIIVRMKGISESAVKTMAGTTLFTDVAASHWASGYVNEASQLGIVKGVSATQFAPDREVTIAEFVTMAVRALGAGQLVDAEGTWPTNYVNFANENDLLKDVTAIYTAVSTRMNAATIVANTLETVMWEKVGVKSNGEIEWGKTDPAQTILKNVLKIRAVDGSYKADPTAAASGTCYTVSNVDHSFNTFNVVESLDLSNIKKGLVYDFWLNEDGEIIGIWETEKKDLTKVEFTQIEKVTFVERTTAHWYADKVKLKVNGSDKEYKLTPNFTLAINDSTIYDNSAAIDSTDDLEDYENKDAFGIAYIEGGKLSAIYAEQYTTYAVVDEVKAKTVKFDSKAESAHKVLTEIKIDEDKYDYSVTKDGKGIKITDLEEGDAIAAYLNVTGDRYVVKVLTDSTKGEVTAKSTSKTTVSLDKESMKVYDATLLGKFKNDQNVVVYKDHNDKIVMFTVVEDAASDVAILKYKKAVRNNYDDANFEVKLAYSDGTVSDKLTVDLEGTYDEYFKSTGASIDEVKTIIANRFYTLKGTITSFVEGTTTPHTSKKVNNADTATDLTAGTTYYTYSEINDRVYTTLTAAQAAQEKDSIAQFKAGLTYADLDAFDRADKTEYKEAVGYAIAEDLAIGDALCYEIAGDKLVITSRDNEEPEFVTLVDGGSDLKVNRNSAYIDIDDADFEGVKGKDFEVTSSTKFFKLKADGSNEVKVEAVSFDSLDTTDLAEGTVLADIDYDDKTVGIVFFGLGTDVQRAVETNFAFVEDYQAGSKTRTISVITMNGDKESYTVDNKSDVYSDLDEDLIGSLLDLTVVDGELVEIAELTDEAAGVHDDELTYYNTINEASNKAEGKVSYNNSKSILYVKVEGESRYAFADECLILEKDKNDYKVKSIEDLKKYSADDEEDTLVRTVVTYCDKAADGEEAVVVIFETIKKSN